MVVNISFQNIVRKIGSLSLKILLGKPCSSLILAMKATTTIVAKSGGANATKWPYFVM